MVTTGNLLIQMKTGFISISPNFELLLEIFLLTFALSTLGRPYVHLNLGSKIEIVDYYALSCLVFELKTRYILQDVFI
jgi:hypothetical protein